MSPEKVSIYEMSVNFREELQAHSLSNSGTSSIRLLPRRQLLANGTEVDACSGNILKHYHAALLREYVGETGLSICPVCRVGDGRRAAALVNQPGYENLSLDRILGECCLCDTHGFLITGKNAAADGTRETRERLSKHSLLEFSFALALPDQQAETLHLFTRLGTEEGGQMLMKRSARSASYSYCIRYRSVGIGMDTDRWRLLVTDEEERCRRHRAILCALRDCILSPVGAQTATMLPHLTGLAGAIVMQNEVGRAPMYSPLEDEFLTRLTNLASNARRIITFTSVDEFNSVMEDLIATSIPYSISMKDSMNLG